VSKKKKRKSKSKSKKKKKAESSSDSSSDSSGAVNPARAFCLHHARSCAACARCRCAQRVLRHGTLAALCVRPPMCGWLQLLLSRLRIRMRCGRLELCGVANDADSGDEAAKAGEIEAYAESKLHTICFKSPHCMTCIKSPHNVSRPSDLRVPAVFPPLAQRLTTSIAARCTLVLQKRWMKRTPHW